jgi:hypothetical protein
VYDIIFTGRWSFIIPVIVAVRSRVLSPAFSYAYIDVYPAPYVWLRMGVAKCEVIFSYPVQGTPYMSIHCD